MQTSNVKRLAMKSEASTDTVGLSEATQDSFQVMTVELALVPTRVMQGLPTTTFSLQIQVRACKLNTCIVVLEKWREINIG